VQSLNDSVWNSLKSLKMYVEKENFYGYDPYDALISPLTKLLPENSRYPRIFLTQGIRRLPINIRSLLGIKKGLNPKGLGLFLSGFVKLYSLTKYKSDRDQIENLFQLLTQLKSNGYSGDCWGFNFPWQNRNQLFPAYTPTIVNTSFVGHSLIDAYEVLGESIYFDSARSAGKFIQSDLQIVQKTQNELCLSYTPLDNERVYNANSLGASLLARIYFHTKEQKLLDYARMMMNYVVNRQRDDGSWDYGERNSQDWIDIHHTGFILDSIFDFMKTTNSSDYDAPLKNGLNYFINNFFQPNGRPKLFHNNEYLCDIHAVQGIISLVKLNPVKNNSGLLSLLVRWIINNMQDKSGYFYYQKRKYFTNKISYIRWSQAWTFLALTSYIEFLNQNKK
jgi:rhamnogalacturonyl hydrolase YesR